MLNLSTLARFACRAADKAPDWRYAPHGFYNAAVDVDDRPWQLVGVATGAVNGFDVIDIDPRNGGHLWLEANQHRIPITRRHRTRSGGWHYLLNYGGRRLKKQLALGVDLKGDKGYVVWWPREGFAIDDHPIADWPADLLDEATKVGSDNTQRAEGVGDTAPGAPSTVRTISVKRRTYVILQRIERAKKGHRNETLSKGSYLMGTMIGEGRLKREIAEHLLKQAAKDCGLWDEGPEACLKTIRSGLEAGMRDYVGAGSGITSALAPAVDVTRGKVVGIGR
jgi:hypothetical protein